MQHEPLDQTNPENRCTVDGVEYVACEESGVACIWQSGISCIARDEYSLYFSNLCKSLVCRRNIWRPASEFGPSEADRLREINRELLEALELAVYELGMCYNVTDYPGGCNSSQGRAVEKLEPVISKARAAIESTKEHE